MAILMKALMDEFYALHKQANQEENYDAAQIYSLGESHANNCHQKSPREIIDYLRLVMNPIDGSDLSEEELFAYEIVQSVVDAHEQRLLKDGIL